MPQQKSRPDTHRVGAGPTDSNRSTPRPIGTDSTANDDIRRVLRELLAAILAAPADQVTDVTSILAGAVRYLDAPCADIVDVAATLAATGIAPTATEVNAELLRLGMFSGHHGDRIRTRLLDATTGAATYPQQLARRAADVAAFVFRARLSAAGQALIERAATGSESDAWTAVQTAHADLDAAHTVLVSLRRLTGQETAA